MLNARALLGSHDVLFITLDTLRFDVADALMRAGRTPTLAARFPAGWEKRHAPGNFTFSSHQAFFAGFLPTPESPGPHPRLFALAFEGSETTVEETLVFDAPDIVTGFREAGYRAYCAGGVGFFNKRTPLGRAMPDLFDESEWRESFGVTDPRSTHNQVAWLLERLASRPKEERAFVFLNVSALHQPNRGYIPGAREDDVETHGAALRYVDGALAPLFEALEARGPTLAVVCSDHGTAYGEDGYHGHRLAHPSVWEVPYAHALLGGTP
jgi:hypothetical protein